MKAIILLGAPGAGKGTLAEGIRSSTDYLHVSTGDMLRAAIKAGSRTGLEAKAYMEKGELVPDAVILRIVGERLAQGQATDKYMFDGFPRTLEQARQLDETLAKLGAGRQSGFPARSAHARHRQPPERPPDLQELRRGLPRDEHPPQAGGGLRPVRRPAVPAARRQRSHRAEPAGSLPAADGEPHRFLRKEGHPDPHQRRTNPQAATAELMAKLS
jgi:adenylate kinase